VLRGVAILMVLGRHTLLQRLTVPAPVRFGLLQWQTAGWAGVDLFFVLSGFLVSGLLFAEYRRDGHVRIGRFLIRRGLKIYPAFYVFLALTLLHGARDAPPRPYGGDDLSLARVASETFFVQSYFPHVWSHTWSLAVEEHFYLLLAASVALMAAWGVRRRPENPFRAIVPVTIGLAVCSLGMRSAVAATAPNASSLRFMATHLRTDALAFGVLLAYCTHFHRTASEAWVRRHRWRIICASAVLVAPVLVVGADRAIVQSVGLTMLYLGFGGILLVAVLAPEAPARIAQPALAAIAWLGTYSYSVYLWQMPMAGWASPAVARLTGWTPSSGARVALYLVASVVVGVGMAKLVEMPVLALRDRWLPSPGRAAARPRGALDAVPAS
jgi:peptidoglycan/LPS O-acetylase OafA/YrhL